MGTWVSGNAMAFYVGGTGTRTASAWKKANALGEDRQPLLHIEYTTGGVFERYVLDGNDDVEESSVLDLDDDSLSFVASVVCTAEEVVSLKVELPEGVSQGVETLRGLTLVLVPNVGLVVVATALEGGTLESERDPLTT